MKRKHLLLIAWVLLITALLTLTLVGCKRDDPEPDPTPAPTPTPDPTPDPIPDPDPTEKIDFSKAGNSIYFDTGLYEQAENIRVRISIYCGELLPYTDSSEDATVRILAMDGYDPSFVGTVGRYSIAVENEKLTVRASDVKAMQFAATRLYKMMNANGFSIARGFSENKLFDNYKSRTGFLAELTEEKITEMTTVDRITVGEKQVEGFTPHETEYTVSYPSLEGYP